MARRKRRSTATRSRGRSSKKPTITLNVPKSILREIYGVFFLGLGLFTILALNNNFGIVGEAWVSFLKPIMGWGIYGFPVALVTIALMYFLSKKINFPLSRILGVFLIMLSILSIIHLSVPSTDVYSAAKAGEYGGYIGFMTTFALLEVLKMGTVGASAIFLVVFLTGILLTFQVSLMQILVFLKPSLPQIQFNRVDDLGETRPSKTEQVNLDEMDQDTAEIIKKIEKMADEDFAQPHKISENETVPTLQIRRAAISQSTSEVDAKEIDTKVRKIAIKNESAEALTSKPGTVGYEWAPPSYDLLVPPATGVAQDDELLADNARKIQAKLEQFGLSVTMHEVHVGPTVIQYTLKTKEVIKFSKITALKNYLALALADK
ncbi:DNA translocase FtsK 4TM domain-containing protein, partial [Candidatus Peregrinibacteria bacterium]|nr:DNA translocase FtsK 4TM domain-containing protein [Candidatus Peregrinibacteria bacterium]